MKALSKSSLIPPPMQYVCYINSIPTLYHQVSAISYKALLNTCITNGRVQPDVCWTDQPTSGLANAHLSVTSSWTRPLLIRANHSHLAVCHF